MDIGILVTSAAIVDHYIRSSVIILLTGTIVTGLAVLIYVYRGKLFRKS